MANEKNSTLSSSELAEVARLFAVLAEPARLVILQALQGGPLAVNQLVERCSMKQANVSKHLAVLHTRHLVKRERIGNLVIYEVADPMVYSLCHLVCSKMQRDLKRAVALFAPEI
jgi:DNA-binding transcriptional ArsR family regulator